MKHLPQHLRGALTLNKAQTPRPWMFVVGLSTLVPLLLGIIRSEPEYSIFGALMGYCLSLCTEVGPLWHRIRVSLLAALTMTLAFSLGIYTQHSLETFVVLTAFIVYALGILSGRGGELERVLVLSGVHFIVARYTPALKPGAIPIVFNYMLAALTTVIVANLLVSRIWPSTNELRAKIRHSFSQFVTLDKVRHYYALTYTTAILLSIALVEHYSIDRGYWTIITAVIIMKPTKQESFYRIWQRIFGTVLGLMVGELLILAHFSQGPLIGIATIFATLIPFVWSRNYWLVALCVTGFLISLLEIAAHGNLTFAVAFLRLEATLLGCGISGAVIFLFQVFEPKNKKISS